MPARIVVDLYLVMPESVLFVRESAIDQLFESLNAERFQLENLGARHQRTVDVEKRVIRCRADQSQASRFDIRQQDVLLRFVKMMNLVDEQNRFPARSSKPVDRGRDDPPHLA